MHKLEFRMAICLGIMALTASPTSYAEFITPEADGKWNIKCECLRNFNNCDKEFFAKAEGKSKHYWYQEGYLKKGARIDLASVCYRNRDIYNRGEESCCVIPNKEEATIKNLFKGSLHKEIKAPLTKP